MSIFVSWEKNEGAWSKIYKAISLVTPPPSTLLIFFISFRGLSTMDLSFPKPFKPRSFLKFPHLESQ